MKEQSRIITEEQWKEYLALKEKYDTLLDVVYEYIKIYGVEKACSKWLQKYAELER